ncbi:THO complex subunit 6 isoform X3 [Taeniopygia guttata]|uniref:THO complex subunit 6 isoform X3 n=1 Tax=Taeniopygia guttata TaxID=59729 RepID=UPI003BB86CE5
MALSSPSGGVRRARQLLHVSVLAQSASPCGRFLAAANDFGEIAIFGLSAALSAEAKEENRRAVAVVRAHNGPVYSLASTERLLLSGSDGEIRAWSWAELGRKGCRELWTRRPPCRSSLEVPEINGLEVNQRDHWVALAGGDGAVRVLDLESGAFTHELRGHQDLVHVVALREQLPQVLSGGEDGTVRLWDLRTGAQVQLIEVHKYQVLSGGVGPALHLLQLSGDVRGKVPVTPAALRSLCLHPRSPEHQVLTVAGNSPKIDVFTNLGYRAFSLSFT